MENEEGARNSNVYSQKVKAGRKRTYFFDVMKTRGDDYYLTLTESTRRSDGNGYTRHQIFLYKEDFNRFAEGLMDVINHVKTDLIPDFDYDQFAHRDQVQSEENESGISEKEAEKSDDEDKISW
ncbi:MAG: DUF3276 family protein [Saprospiraceae bacterium]